MISTRELKGSKEEIARQIEEEQGSIVSVWMVVEEPANASFNPPSEEEFAQLMAELEALAVNVPHVDYSREAMYTRMPGE